MERLTDLPNIGPVLAGNLERSGVTTPDQLRAMGEAEAFVKIRAQADPEACLHQLEALAGAVAGVRKSQLPAEKRAELKRWYQTLRGENSGCSK